MEQQLDAFTQKRFELMVEMATKKLQQEIQSLKENILSINNEMGSVKSQISRLQFQPQLKTENFAEQNFQPKEKVKIVDCRPDGEKHEEFKSGAARNSEPIRPRFGDYKSEDVSIDKFFYFGRK